MNDMIRNCDHFNDHLLAYMEREDDDATRAAMERITTRQTRTMVVRMARTLSNRDATITRRSSRGVRGFVSGLREAD